MSVILAVTEQRDGTLRKVSHEVVAAARQLADGLGATVVAVVFGNGDVGGTAELGGFGADRVLAANHADFANWRRWYLRPPQPGAT